MKQIWPHTRLQPLFSAGILITALGCQPPPTTPLTQAEAEQNDMLDASDEWSSDLAADAGENIEPFQDVPYEDRISTQDSQACIDQDGDGYGPGTDLSYDIQGNACPRGDCDDQNPRVHPFAKEVSRFDGKDQDCGGSDAVDASVPDPTATLQAAIAIASRGSTVWVGPGTYLEHDLSFADKTLILRSTHGPMATRVDTQGRGRGATIRHRGGAQTVLDGLTFTGGKADNGGALRLEGGSYGLQNLILANSQASAYGGCLYALDASVTAYQLSLSGCTAHVGGGAYLQDTTASLSQLQIKDASSQQDGGGLALYRSTVNIQDAQAEACQATEGAGGAIRLQFSDATLTRVSIRNSMSSSSGGGLTAESSDVRLQTLTVEDCSSEAGGGIAVLDGILQAEDVLLTGNRATYDGGGAYLNRSSAVLAGLQAFGNRTASSGGGLMQYYGTLTLTDAKFEGNSCQGGGGGAATIYGQLQASDLQANHNQSAGEGGGLEFYDASVNISRLSLLGNAAYTYGGGMRAAFSDMLLSDVKVNDNHVAQRGGGLAARDTGLRLINLDLSRNQAGLLGGGILSEYGTLALENASLIGNLVGINGGGAFLQDTALQARDLLLLGNEAEIEGGGLYLITTPVSLQTYHPTYLTQTSLVGNRALRGGGIFQSNNLLHLRGCLMGYNVGANIAREDSSTTSLEGNLLYAPYGVSHALGDISAQNLEEDPQLIAYSDDGNLANDDLHLKPGSPLRDAGVEDVDGDGDTWADGEANDPDQDPDGSRRDMGAMNVPGLAFSYYDDTDADGLYDGYEAAHGLSLGARDGEADPDADGLDNLSELARGTDPQRADSDADGYLDGAELAADPLNPWIIPAGLAGSTTIPLEVPRQFPSVQAAIDAIPTQGTIRLAAGQYDENLRVENRDITLVGAGAAGLTVLDGGSRGTVLTALQANLRLEGLTLTHGSGSLGGGLAMFYAKGDLKALNIEQNKATRGAGLYLEYSAPSLKWSSIQNNVAGEDGGGIYLLDGNLWLEQGKVLGNQALRGGGVYQVGSYPTFLQVVVAGNGAAEGGGLYLAEWASPGIFGSAFVYNEGFNLYRTATPGSPTIRTSAFYHPDGDNVYGLTLDGSNLTADPAFLTAPVWNELTGSWSLTELHLAAGSPLIDAGEYSRTDLDGTRADIGIYGGMSGAGWDRDDDGYPDYFWPGGLEAAPEGFDPQTYDADDLNANRH